MRGPIARRWLYASHAEGTTRRRGAYRPPRKCHCPCPHGCLTLELAAERYIYGGPSRKLMKNRQLFYPVLLLLAYSLPALGQAAPVTQALVSADTASANKVGPAGIVPVQTGYNFSLVSSSQRDSGGGWSSILTPDVAFRFNRHASIDFSVPTFVYFLASVNTGTNANPVYTPEPRHFAAGDGSLAFHLDFEGDLISYSFTAALGVPTGNSTYGLTAGKATYNLNNHFDLSLGRLTPDVELGISDSSALVNQRFSRGRSFSSTGKLAHFQAGSSIDLPAHLGFEADLYEDMPIGSQQVVVGNTTVTGGGVGRSNRGNRGKNAKGAAQGASNGTTPTTASSGLAEDNGIYTSLDIPLNPHLVLSAIYGYSLRQRDQTAGFSLTYLLRAHPTANH